jgi:hypothetical protein
LPESTEIDTAPGTPMSTDVARTRARTTRPTRRAMARIFSAFAPVPGRLAQATSVA